jgi:cation diffusion facilitator CzcD-associated flavoprotein CzcO
MTDRYDKYCIIGAGSSGLAAAKNFLAAGIPFHCLEREDDVGGNWYYGKPASSVYASTHLISSKRLTEYTDFPMPDEWPEYPSHEQALEYFRRYARHFGLYEHIEFNTGVEWVEPARDVAAREETSGSLPSAGRAGEGGGAMDTLQPAPLTPPRKGEGNGKSPVADVQGQARSFGGPQDDMGGWLVRLANGDERRYRGVVIANGHNWDPRWPEYPGEFAGRSLHSSQYKTPDILRSQRVLVVGGGNSGCDLAVEAAVHARSALLSVRRAYPVLPKFFRGRPIDQCGELLKWLHMPLWMRRMAGAFVSHLVLGPAWRTGVPRPDHKLFESHPIINSQLHYHVGHGNVELRPDVERLAGDRVRFVDGREDPVDLIVYATGFRVSFPFIDESHLNWRDGAPRLFFNVFHPQRDDLFCLGLIQPASGQWGLVDYQAQLVARYLQAVRRGDRRAAWFRQLKGGEAPDLSCGVRYVDSPRHALEVEHYGYHRRLKKLIAKLG